MNNSIERVKMSLSREGLILKATDGTKSILNSKAMFDSVDEFNFKRKSLTVFPPTDEILVDIYELEEDAYLDQILVSVGVFHWPKTRALTEHQVVDFLERYKYLTPMTIRATFFPVISKDLLSVIVMDKFFDNQGLRLNLFDADAKYILWKSSARYQIIVPHDFNGANY